MLQTKLYAKFGIKPVHRGLDVATPDTLVYFVLILLRQQTVLKPMGRPHSDQRQHKNSHRKHDDRLPLSHQMIRPSRRSRPRGRSEPSLARRAQPTLVSPLSTSR
jgi:hypothetical protein